MCVTEKRDPLMKGRMACNSKPTRDWLTKEDTSSPTVGLDSLFFASVIDAKEKRDVMMADAPSAFIQTKLKCEKGHGEDNHEDHRSACGFTVSGESI